MTSLCRYQHPAFMLTHLQIYSLSRVSIFSILSSVFIYFWEISKPNLLGPLDVDFLHHVCISHDIFLPQTFISDEISIIFS